MRTATKRDKDGNPLKNAEGKLIEITDPFNSAKLLNEVKVNLYDAYTSFATNGSWIRAEQLCIEVAERLCALGFGHEFIDVDDQQWNASYWMISPNGGGQPSGDDD